MHIACISFVFSILISYFKTRVCYIYPSKFSKCQFYKYAILLWNKLVYKINSQGFSEWHCLKERMAIIKSMKWVDRIIMIFDRLCTDKKQSNVWRILTHSSEYPIHLRVPFTNGLVFNRAQCVVARITLIVVLKNNKCSKSWLQPSVINLSRMQSHKHYKYFIISTYKNDNQVVLGFTLTKTDLLEIWSLIPLLILLYHLKAKQWSYYI